MAEEELEWRVCDLPYYEYRTSFGLGGLFMGAKTGPARPVLSSDQIRRDRALSLIPYVLGVQKVVNDD